MPFFCYCGYESLIRIFNQFIFLKNTINKILKLIEF